MRNLKTRIAELEGVRRKSNRSTNLPGCGLAQMSAELLAALEAVAEAAKHFGVAKDSPRTVKLHAALANLTAVRKGLR